MRPGSITTTQVRRIRELAADGASYEMIAAEVGCSPSTAQRYDTGPRRGWRKPDLALARRVVSAAQHVPPGERHGLVERFGHASLNSFNTMLCRHRKRLGISPPPTPLSPSTLCGGPLPHPKAGGLQDEKDPSGRGPADPGSRADAPSRCTSRPAASIPSRIRTET